MPELVTVADITDAAGRIAGVIRPTPVDRSDNLSRLCARPVIIKPEHLQRTGSFKIRGAYNRISRLEATNRVVAASAGNHAQGVALASTLCGLQSLLFMPITTPLPKIEATRAYGAEVRIEGTDVDECMRLAQEHAAATGAVFVPPFDDPFVIAGQGTIGLELADEAPEATAVVVPVGGGGLVAGIATALAARRPEVTVFGVEAAGAATMREALDNEGPVTLSTASTMADGTAVRRVSDLTYAHASALGIQVVTVDEEEISRALLLLLERAKWVVEPSGALSIAALLAGKIDHDGPAVALCSGGNVDPLLLIKLIEHGLSAAGRYQMLRIVVRDQPGALARILTEVARTRANVLDVGHHRAGVELGIDEVEVLLTLETRAREHQAEVIAALQAAGYHPTS